MMVGTLGRTILGPLAGGRQIACCCLHLTRCLLQPERQLHTSSTIKNVLPVTPAASAVYNNLAQRGLQHRPTSRLLAHGINTAAEAQQQDIFEHVEEQVHKTEYESAYVNFFALTGLLDRDMSTYQKPNGDFTFQIRVYPHEQQQSVKFRIEAQGSLASELRKKLKQLPEGALLSITGELAESQQTHGQLKVVATHVGICDSVPDHIATARANHQAWRNAGGEERAVAAAVSKSSGCLTPGEGGMPLEASSDHEACWMELFTNPASYYDNRLTKTGRRPDFKCKADSNKALWLDDRRTPRWVMDNLQLLPSQSPYTPPQASPANTPSQPGVNKFAFMPIQASNDQEALWMELFNAYDRWWDNRANKLAPNRPDFRKKDNRDIALWIGSLKYPTPSWVTENIDIALPSPPK